MRGLKEMTVEEKKIAYVELVKNWDNKTIPELAQLLDIKDSCIVTMASKLREKGVALTKKPVLGARKWMDDEFVDQLKKLYPNG